MCLEGMSSRLYCQFLAGTHTLTLTLTHTHSHSLTHTHTHSHTHTHTHSLTHTYTHTHSHTHTHTHTYTHTHTHTHTHSTVKGMAPRSLCTYHALEPLKSITTLMTGALGTYSLKPAKHRTVKLRSSQAAVTQRHNLSHKTLNYDYK